MGAVDGDLYGEEGGGGRGGEAEEEREGGGQAAAAARHCAGRREGRGVRMLAERRVGRLCGGMVRDRGGVRDGEEGRRRGTSRGEETWRWHGGRAEDRWVERVNNWERIAPRWEDEKRKRSKDEETTRSMEGHEHDQSGGR